MCKLHRVIKSLNGMGHSWALALPGVCRDSCSGLEGGCLFSLEATSGPNHSLPISLPSCPLPPSVLLPSLRVPCLHSSILGCISSLHMPCLCSSMLACNPSLHVPCLCSSVLTCKPCLCLLPLSALQYAWAHCLAFLFAPPGSGCSARLWQPPPLLPPRMPTRLDERRRVSDTVVRRQGLGKQACFLCFC